MFLSENMSPIFSNKSKSSGHDVGIGVPIDAGPNNTPYDIIEHDVTDLNNLLNLPKPDSFDALQLGSDR